MARGCMYTKDKILEILRNDDIYQRSNNRLIVEALERRERQHCKPERVHGPILPAAVQTNSTWRRLGALMERGLENIFTGAAIPHCLAAEVGQSSGGHLPPPSEPVVSLSGPRATSLRHRGKAVQNMFYELEDELERKKGTIQRLMTQLAKQTIERDEARSGKWHRDR